VEWDSANPGSNYTASIVHEAEEIRLPAMFKVCQGLHKRYKIDLWYGDAMNELMVTLLFQGADGTPFPLGPAPYFDNPNATTLYLLAIKELTWSDKKVLWLGEGSSLPGHIRNLPKDKPFNISEYPPVAALGYVAAAIYLWLQLEYEKKPKTGPQKIIDEVERGPQDDSDGLPFGTVPGVLPEDGGFFGGEEW
jgi:hypothetical protein